MATVYKIEVEIVSDWVNYTEADIEEMIKEAVESVSKETYFSAEEKEALIARIDALEAKLSEQVKEEVVEAIRRSKIKVSHIKCISRT